MRNWKKSLVLGVTALVMMASAAFANDRIEISVTGGGEDTMILDRIFRCGR